MILCEYRQINGRIADKPSTGPRLHACYRNTLHHMTGFKYTGSKVQVFGTRKMCSDRSCRNTALAAVRLIDVAHLPKFRSRTIGTLYMRRDSSFVFELFTNKDIFAAKFKHMIWEQFLSGEVRESNPVKLHSSRRAEFNIIAARHKAVKMRNVWENMYEDRAYRYEQQRRLSEIRTARVYL